MITKEQRKKIEELVVKVMSILDVSNKNPTHYQEMFKGMSDVEFEKYLKGMASDDDNNFYLEVVPWENEPTLDAIKLAAKFLNLPLERNVYYRHDDNKDNPVRTSYPVPVGYMHVKRLQQILTKKTGFSTETSQRNTITGQLSGAASVGRVADEETIALATVENSDAILKELLGPRADNKDKRLQMYQAIQRDGFVSQRDLVGDSANQGTLNYLNVIFLGAGMQTDLIDATLINRASLDKNSRK